jgi:F-type H+-transporting ATPase subunit epsilon
MNGTLHLTVTTPARVLVDSDQVVAVRSEDQSGSFGVWPGHADLLTVLAPSVVRWRTADGAARFCAVGGGVFTVSAGRNVSVACREGVVGDSLQDLQEKVRALREQQLEDDSKARTARTRAHAFAVRQLVRYLRPSPDAIAPLQGEDAS